MWRAEDHLGPINVQADGQGNFGPTPPGGHVLGFGQYKLRLDTNAPGGHKFKVFCVECEAPPAVTTPPANVTPAPRPGANVVQPSAQIVTAQPRTAG